MVGEGAGVVVVESLESALQRNVPIYAEVLGYGLSCDAYHMTMPHADGIAEAIVKSLQESGIGPADVDFEASRATERLGVVTQRVLCLGDADGQMAKPQLLDLRDLLDKQSQGTPGADDADGRVVSVQHQDIAIQRAVFNGEHEREYIPRPPSRESEFGAKDIALVMVWGLRQKGLHR